MVYDLHCHTTCSDGELSPADLIDKAVENGVQTLSITDHDTLAAYSSLQSTTPNALTLIPGVEFSTQWNGIGIHIVGLNVALECGALKSGEQAQQQARLSRAEKIAEKLEKFGLERPLEGAKQEAGSATLSRPHFARYMVKAGFSKSIDQAFKKYLGSGKPCDIKQHWAELETVVAWIKDSGGIAVLAHPHKYKMTRSKLVRFLDSFQACGGEAIEVISGNQAPNITQNMAQLAEQRNLLASLGSDFHSPRQSWVKLGMHTGLPKSCKPVWERF